MGGEGGIFSNISKGGVHVSLDAQLNHRDEQGRFDRRAIMLAALKDPSQNYIRILKELGQVPENYANYIAKYWYDPNWASADSPCWWKAIQPIEPIIRQSLIDAIELANESNAIIDSYWMPIVTEECQVLITRSEAQVTRLVLTPPTPLPPKNWATIWTDVADIWVVKRGEVEPWEVLADNSDGRHGQNFMTRLRAAP